MILIDRSVNVNKGRVSYCMYYKQFLRRPTANYQYQPQLRIVISIGWFVIPDHSVEFFSFSILNTSLLKQKLLIYIFSSLNKIIFVKTTF